MGSISDACFCAYPPRGDAARVHGICICRAIDRPDEKHAHHWHHGGLWANQHHRRTGPLMKSLIVFSHLRWDFVYQRPQHLMSRLARHWRILFVEEPVFDAGDPWAEL